MKTIRPWGNFAVLFETDETKVKKITVNPNQRLSYQSHDFRDEVWFIFSGKAKVTINDVVVSVNCGSSVFIPRNTKHRIESLGDEVIFFESQTGSSFSEDDIIRYEDDYNRI